MKKLIFLMIAILLFFSSLSIAQAIILEKVQKEAEIPEKVYDSELLELLINNDIEFSEDDLTRLSKEEFIPLIVKHTPIDFIDKKMSKFKTLSRDFEQSNERIGDIASGVRGKTVRTFKYFPLTAVKVPKNKVADFSKEVRRIIPSSTISLEKEFKILLDESVPRIGAPTAWSSGYDGTGVTIAIVDTGIDYTHPDFSGKILAGYDFVNDDNNPTDDHGHGTHCAGIAAGTGAASSDKFKGVAPGASLLIAKVCDAGGSCPLNAIVSGIEWAVDNGADVISMSLGGAGRSSDMENAVRLAVNQGVVVSIAAGNSGDSYGTILTPGVTEEAITVGASYKKDYTGTHWGDSNPIKDQTTYWSSRGPTDDNLVKPDIVSPGAYICAARGSGTSMGDIDACVNNQYTSASGTSMATPHVAGAAALILQAHPSWTPEEVKAALVETAKNNDYNVYLQGSGRIDLPRAINPIILIQKPVISIGQVSSGETSRTLSISIKNSAGSNQGIRITDDVLKGIYYHDVYDAIGGFTQNDFCLSPGETKSVSFTVSLSSITPDVYSGLLNVYAYPNCNFGSTPDRSTVPVGLVKMHVVNINFTSPIHFENHEIKRWTVSFSDGDGTEQKEFFKRLNSLEEETPPYFYRTFYTIKNHFDVVISFHTKSYSEPKQCKVTYMITEADLTGIEEITLQFDENDANDIITNIDSLITSNGMSRYYYASNLWWETGSYDAYAKISNHPIGDEGKPLGIGVYSSILNTYKLIYWVGAKKTTGPTNEERLILPVLFEYPFTNLYQNIPESELKEVDFRIEDEIKNIDRVMLDLSPWHRDYTQSIMVGDSWTDVPKDVKVFLRNVNPFTYRTNVYTGVSEPYVFDEALWDAEDFSSLCMLCPPFEPNLEAISYLLVGDMDSDLKRKYIDAGLGNVANFYVRSELNNIRITKPNGEVYVPERSYWTISCSGVSCPVGWYDIYWEIGFQVGPTLTYEGEAYYDGTEWSSTHLAEGCSSDGTINNICSEDCGADPNCDAKVGWEIWCGPNDILKKCDSNCQYTEINCKEEYGSNYICSYSQCRAGGGGGGGWWRPPRMLGLTEGDIMIIIVTVVLIVIILGVFKFFAKKT